MVARILIVDQDRLLTDLLTNALSSDVCTVLVADSLAAAKTALVHESPDVTVVDAHLSDALPFILNLHSAGTPVIALVKTDRTRDQLRLAEVSVVDRRGSLAALIDAISGVIKVGIELDRVTSLHVLVVDDEDGIRRMLSEFLTRRGYVVSTARSGKEALRMLDSHPDIAVVLLDITMPQMNGLETLTRITKRKAPPGVIMISGGSDTFIAQRTLSLGAFGYIVKPLDLSELEGTLSAYAARRERAS